MQFNILLSQNTGITHRYLNVDFITGSTQDHKELCNALLLTKNARKKKKKVNIKK